MVKKDAEYFVFEACEYRRHFLSYYPDYAIMTNIDFDHPDYFANIDDVFSAIPRNGNACEERNYRLRR